MSGHRSSGNISKTYRSSPDGIASNISTHTAAITVGVTEEMQDSVHSLSTPFGGYYEWKQDYRMKEERKNSSHQS